MTRLPAAASLRLLILHLERRTVPSEAAYADLDVAVLRSFARQARWARERAALLALDPLPLVVACLRATLAALTAEGDGQASVAERDSRLATPRDPRPDLDTD